MKDKQMSYILAFEKLAIITDFSDFKAANFNCNFIE
jgi:hypothetical protein